MGIFVLTVKKRTVKSSERNPTGKVAFLRLVEDGNFDIEDHKDAITAYKAEGYDSVVVAKEINILDDNEELVEGEVYVRQLKGLGNPVYLSRYHGSHFSEQFNCEYVSWESVRDLSELISDEPDRAIIHVPAHIDRTATLAKATF